MQAADLVLRDVHVPAAPSVWPPAPGYWLVATCVLLVFFVLWWARRQRARKRDSWMKLFDDASAEPSASAQIAGVSTLLRRAARRVDPDADKLEGEDWLRFLDGAGSQDFSNGPGRLLLEGGYRRDVDHDQWLAAKEIVRTRFMELMAKRK